jgi:hypothetical protein
LLLAVSIYPLLLMAREIAIGSRLNERYAVELNFSEKAGMSAEVIEAELSGHRVELRDDSPTSDDREARVEGTVRVVVDGRDYAHAAPVTIRPAFSDANRYWGYVYLTKLVDRQDGTAHLVVALNIGRDRYRLLWVGADGRVTDEEFNYADRCLDPKRVLVIRNVAGRSPGYCSDLLQAWPSFWYPILFPWLSGATGLVCTLRGTAIAWRRRQSRKASA